MSSVSPSDGRIGSYYSKSMQEFQDETERQTKHTRELHEKQLKQMEKDYRSALHRKDKEADETIKTIQAAADNELHNQRDKFESALETIKDQTYNRKGVSEGAGIDEQYRKAAEELQNQLDAERSQNRKNEEEITDRYSVQNRRNLQKLERDADETIRKVRNESSEALSQERQRINSQSMAKEKAHDENLDGLARQNNYLRKTVNTMNDEGQTKSKENLLNHEEELKKMNESYLETFRKQGKDAADTIENIKTSANEDLERNRALHQRELQELKEQNLHGVANAGTVDGKIHKKVVQELQESIESQQAKSNENINRVMDNNRQKLKEVNTREDEKIRNLTLHHNEELKDYQEKLNLLQNYDQKLEHQNSEVIQKMVKDKEHESQAENQRIQESFDTINNKLHQQLNEKDAANQRRNSGTIKEKEDAFAERFHKQHLENYEQMSSLNKEYGRQMDDVQKVRKKDQELADTKLQNMVSKAHADGHDALETQAHSYEKTITNNRVSTNKEMELMQKELQKRRTSGDIGLISSAAEETIKVPIVAKYEKQLHEQIDKSERASDQMQRRYVEQYKRVKEDFADKETAIQQQNNQESSLDRSRYFNSIQDTEFQARTKIQEQETSHDREKDALMRQFGNALERQKRDYEHILTSSRNDFVSRLQSTRQEGELNTKTAQRAFNARQSELIREYEKKLSDQKAEHDFLIDDLKSQSQADMRDLERKSKQEVETVVKGYEHRLAQAEAQGKERERYISQHYQDEMDKLRRSYELLSKKKS